MNEKALIEAVTRQDLFAINTLLTQYQDKVYNYAFWVTSSAQAASDITQETFLSAFEVLPTYQGGSFNVWLFKIAVAACQRHFGWKKRVESFLFGSDSQQTEAESNGASSAQHCDTETADNTKEDALMRAVRRLPLKYRNVLVLIDVSGFSYTQAAQALEQTPDEVSKQLARARKLLLSNIALEEKSKNRITLAYSRFL